MSPKIKNILMYSVLAIVLIFAYVYYFGGDKEEADLVSSGPITTSGVANTSGGGAIGGEFLALLLNVKTISLNDSIFSDPAFSSLHDGSIILRPDGTEGRPNPFAPFDFGAPAPSQPAQ